VLLRATLDALTPRSPIEAADLAAVRRILDSGGDPWSRATPLHVTCSAVVVHPPTCRVLLRWHRRQQAWLQVGGHADPGEHDPFGVALREAAEETGLADLTPFPDTDAPAVVHLAVVPVPAAGAEPAHEHADLRYVLATDRPDDVAPETPDAPLRWLDLAEANALTAEDNLRETLARIDFAL
jgi:8-oxo-dGTP pyrophosphatase MutT (NUDIX family)